MSYVIEQTESLLRVFERATPMSPHRLAGYGANAEFWATEVCHCRDLLAGYFDRYKRMKQATDEYVIQNPSAPKWVDGDTRTTRSTKDSEIREILRRLDETSNRFFRRLRDIGVLTDVRISELEKLLGQKIGEE